jgi:hypothetical protein
MNKLRVMAAAAAAMAVVCLGLGASAQTVPAGYVLVNTLNLGANTSNGVVQNGTISFQPVNNLGQPISFRTAGGLGAKATAQFGVTITTQSPGSGYSGSWSCTVAGGTFSSQATCTATVTGGGLVFALTSAGTYTAPPVGITFAGGTYVAGSPATVSTGMTLSGTTVTAVGSGYTVTTAAFPGCTGTIASSVTVNSGAVTAISASGGSCPGGTVVSIAGQGQAGPAPITGTVTDGVSSVLLGDSVSATPANVCYSVTATDNVSGNSVLGVGYTCVQPAGSGAAVSGGQAWCTAGGGGQGGTCAFDTYQPNLTNGVVTQTGPAGPEGVQGAAGAGFLAGISTASISTGYNPVSPTPGANGGGGTDECSKIIQMSYNQDQAGAAGSIFGSYVSAPAYTETCAVAGFWDPTLLVPNPTTLPGSQNSTVLLTPGGTWKMPNEVDIPTLSTLDGQAVYGYLASPDVGTFLEPNLSVFPEGNSGFGTVGMSLGCPSGTSTACFALGAVIRNLSYSCNGLPGMTGMLNASGQQYSRFERVTVHNCSTAFDFESLTSGGGSQNMGLNVENQAYGNGNVPLPVMTGAVVSAGGSGYTEGQAVTVTGCTTAPSYYIHISGSAVASLYDGAPNYKGVNCGGSTAITFSGGSGAAATPIVQNLPRSVAFRLNATGQGAGWGAWLKTDVVALQSEIAVPEGYDLNEGGLWMHPYCEGTFDCFVIGDKHGTNLPAIIVAAEDNPADGNAGNSVVHLSSAFQSNGLVGIGLLGSQGPWEVEDDANQGCDIPQDGYNYEMGVLGLFEDDWGAYRISSDPACATLLPIGNAMTVGAQDYLYLPQKIVSGEVKPMTVGDAAEPVGISVNGYTGSSVGATLEKMSFAKTGASVKCIFDNTPVPGDYVIAQQTGSAVVGAAAGCHDTGSASRPTNPATAPYSLGQVVFDGIYGSDSIPTTPSAPTVGHSNAGSINYCYKTVRVTLLDGSASAPTSAVCDASGANYIGNSQAENLSGLGGTSTAPVQVYRTTLGDTLPSSCTVAWATSVGMTGSLVCGVPGAGLNPNFPPVISFGGGCTTEPVVSEVIVGLGRVLGVNFKSFGAGCSSAPTVNWAHNIGETGLIGTVVGNTLVDAGRAGDGSTPPASGMIAARVNLNIEGIVGAAVAVPGIVQGRCYGTVSASAGTYSLYGLGAQEANATLPCSGVVQNAAKSQANASGTVSQLCVRVATLPTVADVVFSVFDNGASTGISVTIPHTGGTAGVAVCDNTHTFTATQGDLIDVRWPVSASETLASVWASLQIP